MTRYDSLNAAYDTHTPHELPDGLTLPSPRLKRAKHFYIKLAGLLIALNIALWLLWTRDNAAYDAGKELRLLPTIAPEKIVSPTAPQLLNTLSTATANVVVATTTTTANAPSSPPIAALQASTSPAPALVVPSTGETTGETGACYVWEFTNDTDLKRATNVLTDSGWGGFSTELAPVPTTYMVFLGPFQTRSDIDLTIKRLKQLSIEAYNVLPSNEISLSVLDTADAAATFKQKLIQRGLQGVNTRERHSKKQRLRYRFQALTPSSLVALTHLTRTAGMLRACQPTN